MSNICYLNDVELFFCVKYIEKVGDLAVIPSMLVKF